MRFRSYLLPAALIIFGLALRFYQLQTRAGFDFDQETAAWWVRDLLVNHKFSLIGQEISVGGVFIGPAFYYLLAVFYALFRFDPVAGNVMVTVVAGATMLMVYLAARRLFDQKTALLSLFLYAISSSLIFYDRTVAPSNLIMLLSVAALYFLLRQSYFWLGVITGLSFSVHPTAVLLLPIIFLYKIKITKRQLSLFTIPVLLLVSPLIIFDLRHQFLNILGLVHGLASSGIVDSAYPVPFKFLINLRILFVSLAQVVLPINNWLVKFAMVGMVGWAIRKKRPAWLWILTPAVALSFYRLHVPEYYFLMVFPVVLIHFGNWLSRWPKVFLGLFLGVTVFFNLQNFFAFRNPVNLADKKAAVATIAAQSAGATVAVNVNADLGQNNGFNYLFTFYHLRLSSDADKKFTIFVPSQRSTASGEIFGNIKVVR
ncbi:MAG: glycosyltransferase family 39 protein [Patescibacteria group bacterium]|nr:glycosyltransferase family 39 protein [Patescibacteria group bacterium]MCL5431539.1 glycosyltransferase family 39 protein [Patescibacteria group bacterium]